MSGHRGRGVMPAGKGQQCHRLDSAATHFFRIMLPSIIQNKKLRIPKMFITRFRDELSHVATLHVPNGSDWNVKLDRVGKEVYFKDGWHEFVQHFSIKEYYFLVFKYIENSSFEVVVFDQSTTEICYFHGNQCPSHHEEEIDDDDDDDDESIEILGSSPRPRFDPKMLENKKLTLGGSSNPPTKKNFNTTTCGQNVASLKNQEFKREYITRAKRLIMDSVNVVDEDMQLARDGKEGASYGAKTISTGSSMKKPVMTRKREEAINAANMYKPENHSFMLIMRSYDITRKYSVDVPADFARKCLTGPSKFIKFRGLDGTEWPVRCITYDDWRWGISKRWRIGKGWSAFVLENDLKEGDVCVFELIQGAEFVLKVTIFRVNEDGGIMN